MNTADTLLEDALAIRDYVSRLSNPTEIEWQALADALWTIDDRAKIVIRQRYGPKIGIEISRSKYTLQDVDDYIKSKSVT